MEQDQQTRAVAKDRQMEILLRNQMPVPFHVKAGLSRDGAIVLDICPEWYGEDGKGNYTDVAGTGGGSVRLEVWTELRCELSVGV